MDLARSTEIGQLHGDRNPWSRAGNSCWMDAEAARLERLSRLGGSLPPPFGHVDAVLAQQLEALLQLGEAKISMDALLRQLTGSLLAPCTAAGVPAAVPTLVRGSLESVGWDVSRNTPSAGATPPTAPQVASMLHAARQKLAAMADAQAPLTPRTTNDTPQSSGGGGGGGGLSANAPSFSLTAAVPAFVPSNPYSAQPAPQMGGYDRGGAGRAGGRGRGRGRGRGAGKRGATVCRFGMKCTRPDCYFAHPGRDDQPGVCPPVVPEDDPVLADLAAELAALEGLEDSEELPPEEEFEAFLAMSGQTAGATQSSPKGGLAATSSFDDDEFERAQEEWLASNG